MSLEVVTVARVIPVADQPRLAWLFGEEEAARIVAGGKPRDRYGSLIEMKKELTDRERGAFRLRFNLDGKGERSYQQIGQELGFSRWTASRAVDKALSKIRLNSRRSSVSEGAYIVQSPEASFVISPTPGV